MNGFVATLNGQIVRDRNDDERHDPHVEENPDRISKNDTGHDSSSDTGSENDDSETHKRVIHTMVAGRGEE